MARFSYVDTKANSEYQFWPRKARDSSYSAVKNRQGKLQFVCFLSTSIVVDRQICWILLQTHLLCSVRNGRYKLDERAERKAADGKPRIYPLADLLRNSLTFTVNRRSAIGSFPRAPFLAIRLDRRFYEHSYDDEY